MGIKVRSLGYPQHFYLAVGGLSGGAMALLVSRIARLGALMLMVVMAGVSITHSLHGEPQIITTLVSDSPAKHCVECRSARNLQQYAAGSWGGRATLT